MLQAGDIGARLDRLPATRSVWNLVILLSLGGFFEFYDLFFTGYVAPGLVREHILTTTPGLFGSGIAAFVAALFAGLFVGTMLFGFVADRFGRRTIFTVSLLWYAASSAIMAFQTTATWIDVWRFIAGVGIGRRAGHDRHLSERAGAEDDPRPRLRHQPDHSVRRRPIGGVPGLSARSRTTICMGWPGGAGWC